MHLWHSFSWAEGKSAACFCLSCAMQQQSHLNMCIFTSAARSNLSPGAHALVCAGFQEVDMLQNHCAPYISIFLYLSLYLSHLSMFVHGSFKFMDLFQSRPRLHKKGCEERCCQEHVAADWEQWCGIASAAISTTWSSNGATTTSPKKKLLICFVFVLLHLLYHRPHCHLFL